MRLNRTFYGIEICIAHPGHVGRNVLIVPFMELKLLNGRVTPALLSS